LETPRIMTPSNTACPPTGASRAALSSPSPASAGIWALGTSAEARSREAAGAPPSSADAPDCACGSAAHLAGPAARREDIELLRGARLRRLQAALGDSALEALHASTRVHELLAPGVERVAVRAHLYPQLVLSRARQKLVSARAMHARL